MEILFLQAGGTIDKDYIPGDDHHGYNFEIGAPAAKGILEKWGVACKVRFQTVAQKDSTDLTPEDRRLIRAACLATPLGRIVITHGTDTMLQTAAELADIPDKTIVLTGAMRPAPFHDSDARENVAMALGAVQCSAPGVYIAMSGLVLPASGVVFNADAMRFEPVPTA